MNYLTINKLPSCYTIRHKQLICPESRFILGRVSDSVQSIDDAVCCAIRHFMDHNKELVVSYLKAHYGEYDIETELSNIYEIYFNYIDILEKTRH